MTAWLPRPSHTHPTGPRWRPSLTRLEGRDNPSGGIDLTFDTDGMQTTDFGGADTARAVAVQPDGKIVVAGGTGAGDFAVARYNRDGSLDTTFDSDGKQTVDFGSDDRAAGVAVQADGRIVVVGYTNLGASGVNTNNFAIARLNTTGSLDTTFDTDGKLTVDFGSDDRAAGVAVQPDGKIVLAGSQLLGAGADLAFVRLNANGSLDTTFDLDGKVAYPNASEDVLTAVFLQPDGKIVAAGYTNSGGTNDMLVMRLIANGSPDPTFDTDGRQTVNFGGDDRATAVAVQAGGRIVLAGSSDASGNADFAVARLTATGGLDTTFSSDGKATFTFGSGASGQTEVATGVVYRTDGRVVVTGYTDNNSAGGPNNFAVLRLLANGTPDTSFDVDGKLQVDFGGDDVAAGATSQTDGRVIVVGTSGSDFAVTRLDMGAGPLTDIVGRDNSGNWWLNRSTGSSFNVSGATGWYEPAGWRDVLSADFTGDGRADVAGRDAAGNWWVGRSNGSSLLTTLWGNWYEPAGWKDVGTGDFNGDGRADIAGRTAGGTWIVGLSTGTGFAFGSWTSWYEPAGWLDVQFADITGDGRTDVAARTAGGTWIVGASTGTAFALSSWVSWYEPAGWKDAQFADVTGDGRADLLARTAGGTWIVGQNTGSSFALSAWTSWYEPAGWLDIRFADVTGDGRADLLARTTGGTWIVGESTGSTFALSAWASWYEPAGWRDILTGDFNGDGKADVAARTAGGTWIVGTSTGTAFTLGAWATWNESAGWKDVMAGTFVG